MASNFKEQGEDEKDAPIFASADIPHLYRNPSTSWYHNDLEGNDEKFTPIFACADLHENPSPSTSCYDNDLEDEAVVNRLTENNADGDDLHDIRSLINEHNRLNDTAFNNYDVVGDVLRLGLPDDDDENIVQIYNGSVNQMTPLHIAALQGHADVVQNLIDHGADVHAKDSHGCTAIHIAAQKGYFHCLKMLIEAGSEAFASIGMSCKAKAFDRLGATALITAVQHNRIDCVQELLQYGLDVNAVNENQHYFRHVVAEKAISKSMSAYLKIPKQGMIRIKRLSTYPFWHYKVLGYSYKLLSIEKFDTCNSRNGISYIFDWICSLEFFDLEILKVFVLESYSIDPNIPRGLTTLRHYGLEYYNSKIAAILITYLADAGMTEKLGLISYLLRISWGYETLSFVVKCMPSVPPINTLAELPYVNRVSKLQFHAENWNDKTYILPPNAAFALECDPAGTYIAIHDREKVLTNLDLTWSDIVKGTPKYGRYPLKQPLINLINDRISEEIVQLQFTLRNNLHMNVFDDCGKNSYLMQLKDLKRCLSYEAIAVNPPTLHQCCRYSLLKCLGPLKVENIRKLPLPSQLHSYLLLQ